MTKQRTACLVVLVLAIAGFYYWNSQPVEAPAVIDQPAVSQDVE